MFKSNFSDSFDNIYSFLLAISVPIINHINRDIDNLEDNFNNTYWKNRFYSNSKQTVLENQLGEKIFQLVDNFSTDLSEVADECGINGYNPSIEDCNKKINALFYLFCDQLLNNISELINDNNFNIMLIDFKISQDFTKEYKAVQKNLFDNIINLEEAEKSILYWQNAFSDNIMQKVLIHLRYSYIQHLLSSQKSNN